MHFGKTSTSQDVVVACCILYNMLKMSERPQPMYEADDIERQELLYQMVTDAHRDHINEGIRETFRIQNFLINDHF